MHSLSRRVHVHALRTEIQIAEVKQRAELLKESRELTRLLATSIGTVKASGCR